MKKRFFYKIPKDSLPFLSAEVEVAQIVRTAKVSEAQINETELLRLTGELVKL